MNRILNVPEIYGIIPHCETTSPNHECQYIERGCTGCKIVPHTVKMRITDAQMKMFRDLDKKAAKCVVSFKELSATVATLTEKLKGEAGK